MVWTKLPYYLAATSATLLLELVTIPASLILSQAQTTTPTPTIRDSMLARVTFEPPPGQDAPESTVGGGRRNDGQCPQERKTLNQLDVTKATDEFLTPLLPSVKVGESNKTKWGLTVSEHPTFLVYVPKTSAKAAEFTLESPDGTPIYQTTLNLTDTPGVISFSLPTTEPGLEIGKDYKWVVALVCQPRGPEDPFAEGLVRRSQADSALMSQLDKAAPIDRVALYAKYGSWYDALATLATLRRDQPNDPELVSAWKELLQLGQLDLLSGELDAIANAPLRN